MQKLLKCWEEQDKCLEEFPYPQVYCLLEETCWFTINHKFRGGLLGIILSVTTASEDITTAEDCACSGNSLPLQVQSSAVVTSSLAVVNC